jgi:hypothetical protein
MMVHCRPQAFFTESFEKTSSAEWYFVTKLGPQVSPFPAPIFGVNMPLQLRDKSDFISELTINAQRL